MESGRSKTFWLHSTTTYLGLWDFRLWDLIFYLELLYNSVLNIEVKYFISIQIKTVNKFTLSTSQDPGLFNPKLAAKYNCNNYS